MPPKDPAANKAAPKKELKPQTFAGTIVPLVQTLEFYWFLGHVSVLISFFLYNILGFFSKSLFWYKFTLISVLFTYAVILYRVHFKGFNVTRLIRDENFHYFVLALVFYLSCTTLKPLSGSAYSFAIFSLFHALTFFQNKVLSALPISIHLQQNINTRINNFTKSYNEPALVIASNSELLLLISFVFTIPLTPINLIRSPFYAIVNVIVFGAVVVFLKLRYDSSQYTQQVVQSFSQRIDQLLYSPQGAMVPQPVKDGVAKFKSAVSYYLAPITTTNIIKAIGGSTTSAKKEK